MERFQTVFWVLWHFPELAPPLLDELNDEEVDKLEELIRIRTEEEVGITLAQGEERQAEKLATMLNTVVWHRVARG